MSFEDYLSFPSPRYECQSMVCEDCPMYAKGVERETCPLHDALRDEYLGVLE